MADLTEVLARVLYAATGYHGSEALFAAALDAAGYQIVPKEPTEAMVDAIQGNGDCLGDCKTAWREALAAAPKS